MKHLLLFLTIYFVHSATITWTGSGSNNNWVDAGNWDANVPTLDDDVVFPDGDWVVDVPISETAIANSVVFGTGSLVLTVNNNAFFLLVDDMVISDGVTVILDNAEINEDTSSSGNLITIEEGGNLTLVTGSVLEVSVLNHGTVLFVDTDAHNTQPTVLEYDTGDVFEVSSTGVVEVTTTDFRINDGIVVNRGEWTWDASTVFNGNDDSTFQNYGTVDATGEFQYEHFVAVDNWGTQTGTFTFETAEFSNYGTIGGSVTVNSGNVHLYDGTAPQPGFTLECSKPSSSATSCYIYAEIEIPSLHLNGATLYFNVSFDVSSLILAGNLHGLVDHPDSLSNTLTAGTVELGEFSISQFAHLETAEDSTVTFTSDISGISIGAGGIWSNYADFTWTVPKMENDYYSYLNNWGTITFTNNTLFSSAQNDFRGSQDRTAFLNSSINNWGTFSTGSNTLSFQGVELYNWGTLAGNFLSMAGLPDSRMYLYSEGEYSSTTFDHQSQLMILFDLGSDNAIKELHVDGELILIGDNHANEVTMTKSIRSTDSYTWGEEIVSGVGGSLTMVTAFTWNSGGFIDNATGIVSTTATGSIQKMGGLLVFVSDNGKFINQGECTWVSGTIDINQQGEFINEGTFTVDFAASIESNTDENTQADFINLGLLKLKFPMFVDAHFIQCGDATLQLTIDGTGEANFPRITSSSFASLSGTLDLLWGETERVDEAVVFSFTELFYTGFDELTTDSGEFQICYTTEGEKNTEAVIKTTNMFPQCGEAIGTIPSESDFDWGFVDYCQNEVGDDDDSSASEDTEEMEGSDGENSDSSADDDDDDDSATYQIVATFLIILAFIF